MSILNNGYISKARLSTNLKRLFLVVVLVSIAAILTIYFTNRPTMSIYRFNSGLNLSFDLNKWRMLPGASNGDTLTNSENTVSILLTSAKPEDSSKSLSQIVDERISLLSKENLEISKSSLKINGLDFYKVEYSDKGDENVQPDQKGISYITLYNNIYTTVQIFYKNNVDTNDALEIINTIKAD